MKKGGCGKTATKRPLRRKRVLPRRTMKNKEKGRVRRFAGWLSTLALVAALTVGICVPNATGLATTAQAKSKKTKVEKNLKISKKLVKLKKKKSQTIKIKGTKKKVKWSVSDSTIAKIAKKGKVGVKITAKKKAGACVVKGVVGKQTFYCLVMVNNSNAMSNKTKDWAKKGGFTKYLPKVPSKTPSSTNQNKPSPSTPSGGGSAVITETTSETSVPSAGSGTNQPGTNSGNGNNSASSETGNNSGSSGNGNNSGSSGTGSNPTQPEPQTETSAPEPEKPKYDYSIKLVNPTPVYAVGSHNNTGALIKITTNNPDVKGERYMSFRVDGNRQDSTLVNFDDVSYAGYSIAEILFATPGTHKIEVLESYRINGSPRTYLETGVSLSVSVKNSDADRESWIAGLIATHRKSSDKETLSAISGYLASNLHYQEYFVNEDGSVIRSAYLLRHYGPCWVTGYGWDCWATTDLMIDVAKKLNPALTGVSGVLAGNDPEVDWHRVAYITFPDGSVEGYDACPSPTEVYLPGTVGMTM